jgi:trimeric autotransporter adhesin
MCPQRLRRFHRACFILSGWTIVGAVCGGGAFPAFAAESVAQQAYVKASNTGADDEFGRAVAVWGDTLVIGAALEDSAATGVNGNQADESLTDAGAVYVYVRSGSTWSQQAYLKASNPGSDDYFGFSVAIHGDTVVVGAYREDSSATGVNGNQADNGALDSGAAYVFVRNGTTWSQQAYLKPLNTGSQDQFARAVAIHGDTILVGSWFEDSNAIGVNGNANDNSSADSGAAFVFTRSGTTWSQQAYLKASNTGAGDRFGGFQVAVSEDTAVVGAYLEDSNATGVNGNQGSNSADAAGAVYLFARTAGTWSQQAYLKASNTGASDWFGSALSISGDTLVVGAYREDSLATGVNGDATSNGAPDAGAAYVFARSGATWSQEAYLKASNTWPSDWFGYAVAITGDTIVVGAHQEDSTATGVNGNQADNSAEFAGAAYSFSRSGATWSQQAYLKASNTQTFDNFGYSVAAAAGTVVVSSLYEDSNATGVNGDQSNNASSGAGAAYVFTAPCSGTITAFGAGCAGSGGFVPSLAATGCAMNDGYVSIAIGNALGGSTATLLLGIAPTFLPVGGGCAVLVQPSPLVTIAGFPLAGIGPGSGSVTITAPVPATLPPLTVVIQAAIVDPGNVLGVTLTNGVQLAIG